MTQMSDVQRQEQNLLDKSAAWVVRQIKDHVCPFCGAISTGVKDEAGADSFMENHLRTKHPTATVKAWEQKSLQPVLRDEDPDVGVHEALGIEAVQDLDRYDALYIPLEMREEAACNGETLRWTAPAKVRYRADMGAILAKSPSEGMPNQQSREDSTARTNEMVLMRIPEALKTRLDKAKERRINDKLASCVEDLQRSRSKVAEAAYNFMIRRGADTQQAGNVASAIESGAKAGRLPGIRMDITDQHGTTSI